MENFFGAENFERMKKEVNNRRDFWKALLNVPHTKIQKLKMYLQVSFFVFKHLDNLYHLFIAYQMHIAYHQISMHCKELEYYNKLIFLKETWERSGNESAHDLWTSFPVFTVLFSYGTRKVIQVQRQF